jgi:hypothetical protein
LWWALASATLMGLAWVGVPMVLIQPFAAQTPRGIAIAYLMRSWNTVVPPVLLLVTVAAAVPLWARLSGRLARGLAFAAIALLLGTVWLARQNHFEWMFGPLPRPAFVGATGAHGVGPEDLVLGVVRGEEAAAFPVRALAYHHVVNAALGGDALVATY